MKADKAAVDAALAGAAALPPAPSFAEAVELAECVRVRAARQLRRTPAAQRPLLLEARDRLMRAAYAGRVPAGMSCAWCDASRAGDDGPARAGLGVLLRDPDGRLHTRQASVIGIGDPFAAEIAALEATLRLASRRRARRLRVHTDCVALARLWYRRRVDPRLTRVRALADRFERLELRPIPRLHNQPADALARQALAAAGG